MPTLRILGVSGGLLLAGTLWWLASAEDPSGAGSSAPLPETLPQRPATKPRTEEQTLLLAPAAEPVQLSVSAAAPSPSPPGCIVEIWAQQRNATGPGHHPVATQLEFGLSP
ncbi:MAG: hypothetical protein ACI9EF_003527, partial [Pseudohongiellaceae bacterium]